MLLCIKLGSIERMRSFTAVGWLRPDLADFILVVGVQVSGTRRTGFMVTPGNSDWFAPDHIFRIASVAARAPSLSALVWLM